VIADAAGTITSGALPLAILVALAAGFVSFASPCVLPLVPGFLGYVTGLSGAGFKFNNPTAKKTCGCGSSFSA